MYNEASIQKRNEKEELFITSPLIKKLFDFAKKLPNAEYLHDEYTDESGKANANAVELPEEFSGLVSEYPGKYFIVSCEDRRDPYYKKGTRHMRVRLSTASNKSETDDTIREVDFIEKDPSLGGGMHLTVKELVNEKSFVRINDSADNQAAKPHGSFEAEYKLSPDGKKSLIRFRCSRLDEGFFPWGDKTRPVRWLRELDMETVTSPGIIYKDSYIIGRLSKTESDQRAEVMVNIQGNIESPSSILVEIGIGALSSAKTLFEDKSRNIKVIQHKEVRPQDDPMKVLGQDPNYAFLFSGQFNPEQLLENIRSKVRLLQKEWNNPESVFTQKPGIEHKPAIEEN